MLVFVCWACKPDVTLHQRYIISVNWKAGYGRCTVKMLYCLAEAINQRQVPINNNACVHAGYQFSSNRLRCGWSCGWSVHTDRPVYPPRNWWTQGHGERYGEACFTAQTLWLCRGKPPAGSHYISVLSHGMWIQNCFLCFTLGTCRETANELVQPMTWQCAVLLFIGNDIWCKQKLDDGSHQAPQFSLGCREQGSMTGWCCEMAQCKPRDRRASKSSEAPLPLSWRPCWSLKSCSENNQSSDSSQASSSSFISFAWIQHI